MACMKFDENTGLLRKALILKSLRSVSCLGFAVIKTKRKSSDGKCSSISGPVNIGMVTSRNIMSGFSSRIATDQKIYKRGRNLGYEECCPDRKGTQSSDENKIIQRFKRAFQCQSTSYNKFGINDHYSFETQNF